ACFIIATRSAAAAYTSAGALVCVGTAKIVKRVLRQPRPQVIEGARQKRSYGMPSTHSTAMSFFATFIVLACIRLPIHPSLPSSTMMRILPPVIAVPSAALVVMSRVWLGHHTRRQVVAGASYGVAFASVWFTLWTSGLNEYGREVEKIVESHLISMY
ncbi:hypothetical protein M378DRAFT_69116, partial [Amanita muscaria Koide BX008]